MVKARAKRSPIWKLPSSEFEKLVADSTSGKEVLSFFGLRMVGDNWTTARRRCKEQGISTAHFNGKERRAGVRKRNRVPTEEIFIEKSPHSRKLARARILKEGLLNYKCAICGLFPEWKEKPLALILDHENGIYDDHRLSNLRFVCPNCNSQLSTFAGRNVRHRTERRNCLDCGKKVSGKSERCRLCSSRRQKRPSSLRKIEWPSLEELERETEETNFCAVGRRLGVSDNAIRKMMQRMRERNLLGDRLNG